MLNVTNAFKTEWYNGVLSKLCFADIILEDETQFHLTNVQLWAGGFGVDNAVSEDDSFTALGSAIIGSASIIINNIDETYSDYDFMNASVILYVGLELASNQLEKIKLGTYHVDNPHYNGSTITLDLLDNMEQFDRPYTTSLTYPATLNEIVHDACTKCGVTFSSTSEYFPNYTYSVTEKPDGADTTYREVISWAAMIAGCFCKCNADGQLELKWFDISTLESWEDSITDGGLFSPWNNPSSVDGGSFNPWNTGTVLDGGSFTDFSSVHYISSLYSQDICIDDTVITGVRILVKTDSDDEQDAIKEFVQEQTFSGVSSYIIEIENNAFITVDTAQTVLNYLATNLIGVKFRKLNVSHKSDPSIEAGDIAVVIDRKARHYPTLITHVSFNIGSSQTLICGSETPARNKSTRFSSDVKNFVATRKDLLKERSSWQDAEEELSNRISQANGLYTTDVTTSSGTIHYLHNKGPNGTSTDHSGLNSSDIRIMISDVGITMTANGTSPNPTWYGLTVDGVLIASILNAIGVNADWINAGSLSLGGTAQQGFSRDGAIKIYNSSGTLIGQWNKNGIQILAGSINIGNGAFQVSISGVLSATGASISGVLTAGAGSSISSIHVSDTGIYSNNYSTIDSYSIDNRTGFFFGNDGQISLRTTSGSILRYENDSFGIFGHTGSGTSEREVSIWNNPDYAGSTGDHGVKISTYSNLMSLTERYFCVGNRSHSSQSSLYAELRPYDGAGLSMYHYLFHGNMYVSGRSHVVGDFTVDGAKSRIVDTEDYGDRLLYCYETPTPMFGDIGDGVIGDDGLCYIQIDPTFSQAASTDIEYQVFLQKYGAGDVFVKERHGTYFVVQGTPNLAFGWELKAKQRDYEMLRLDKQTDYADTKTTDYGELAYQHIDEIKQERMGEAA